MPTFSSTSSLRVWVTFPVSPVARADGGVEDKAPNGETSPRLLVVLACSFPCAPCAHLRSLASLCAPLRRCHSYVIFSEVGFITITEPPIPTSDLFQPTPDLVQPTSVPLQAVSAPLDADLQELFTRCISSLSTD